MTKAASALSLALLALVASFGCSSDGDEPQSGDTTSGGLANAGASSAGAADLALGGAPASGASGAGGSEDDVVELDAPDEARALLSFLEARQYAGWAKEAASHPSAGPHGDGVRVYYSPRAVESLRSGASIFPAGAAAVKELTRDGALYGYSVWVKVQDATDGGNGFFWYELIRRPGGSDSVSGNARGSSACVGCHRAGNDYSLSTLPFE